MTGNLTLGADGRVTDREGKLLDDGVKVNYPKFYPALKKISGLEAADG